MVPVDLPTTHTHGFWWVLQCRLSRALVDHVLAGDDYPAMKVMGGNPTVEPDAVEALSRHPDPTVRLGVTGRPDLTRDQLLRLASDPEVDVRTAVSTHPGLTEQERAGIDIDVRTAPGDGHYGVGDDLCPWIVISDEAAPDIGDALRWARSVNPLLRRRAARHTDLPTDLVATLADDPDLGVRVLLAQHHPAAPPPLLLRSYLEHECCGRDQLRELPRFPTEGLARFADDPDPAVRRLVALDPDATSDLVDRLTADPDATVRRAMASSPRLSASRITALLDDPELAEPAAANPALTVDQMHRILDRAGILD
jgi:hypothetical protein